MVMLTVQVHVGSGPWIVMMATVHLNCHGVHEGWAAHLAEGAVGGEVDRDGKEGVGRGDRHHKLERAATIAGIDQVHRPQQAVAARIVLVVPVPLCMPR